jgi:8-oxo-dGTP pyrophosphatase MutT (NUDIX family)/GNAT superfamily N-acetyltransferase
MRRVAVVALRHPEHPNLYLHQLRADSGRWTIPGGHMHDGELPKEAARRELFEETGIDLDEMEELRNGQYGGSLVGQDHDPVQVYLFGATIPPERCTAANDPDHEAVTFKYLDPTTCENLAVPPERNILLQYLQQGKTVEKAEKTAAERESEKIRENRKSPEAQRPHDFKPARWTHPNGHPRCILCGSEERIDDRCKGYDPAERAPSGLAKGVMRRKAPFNPEGDYGVHHEYDLKDWQDYESSAIDDYAPEEDLPEHEVKGAMRENIETMDPHARKRALHRLHSLTETRKNPLSGEIEYLLHRGMSTKEHDRYLKVGNKIDHDSRSSWTPRLTTAVGFAEDAQNIKSRTGGGKLVSAWVPESKIAHVPMMYGKTPWGQPGQNPHRHEFEVIVDPGHNSELHDVRSGEQGFKKPTSAPQQLTLPGLKPPADIHRKITERGKKLAASEDLMNLMALEKGRHGDWRKEGYRLSYNPPAAEHGPYALHSVIAKDPAGHLAGQLHAEDMGDGTFMAHIVEVHPVHQRKGLATAMYAAMQRKTGLKATPDLEAQTKEGGKLWAGMRGKLGKSDYHGFGLPMGWISPTGEFYEMEGSAHHRWSIPEEANVGEPKDDDDEKPILDAYHKGWISVGHAGELNIQGHPSVIGKRTHPAMKMARDIVQGVMANQPEETHVVVQQAGHEHPFTTASVPVDHFVRHGTILPRHKLSKGELEKMSRARITFPKLGIGTQDHNVNVITTPRQRQITARAAANEIFPKVPGDVRMQLRGGKRIDRMIRASKQAGSVVGSSNPAGTRSEGRKTFATVFGDRASVRAKQSPAQRLDRQKQIASTVAHEANHLVFNKLTEKLGDKTLRHKVLSKLLDHAFPDAHDRNVLFRYVKARGYDPMDFHSFQEETVNAVQDVLTDPEHRKHFEDWYAKHHGGSLGFKGTQAMTNRLKHGWGRLALAAKQVDESFAKAEYLEKVMDSQYLKDANQGYTALVPVTLGGRKELAPGIPFHITVKMFRKPGEPLTPEHMKRVEDRLERFKLPVPHHSQLRLEPASFVSPRTGQTYYSLKVHGMPKEYGELYDHFRDVGITYPEYMPHVTIDKDMYDDIKAGRIPMDTLKLEVHHPELKLGPKTLKVLA